MKRITALIVSLIVFAAILLDGYFLFIRNAMTGKEAASTSSQSTSSSTSSATSSNRATTMRDGTYTGKSTSTEWGDVQVQMVVSAGKITTVTVLKYPNENGHDKQVNSKALPIYKSEALSKQSAKIQLVSGASETYKGFTGSLQDAINQSEAAS